tara:strand:- start:935 stop:1942 length:1008 start_codon:yes stop_codon:yes gene_type:complete
MSLTQRSLYLLLFGALVLLVYLAVYPRARIFTLDIDTEVVSFVVANPLYSQWDLTGTSVSTDPFSLDEEAIGEGAVLLLNPGVQVEIQRHGVGDVFVRLACEGGSVGEIDALGEQPNPLGPWALLRFRPETRPVVLSFRGYISVGEDVASQVDSLLLGGSVSIIEEKFLGRGHYTAGEEALDTGDRVQLWRRGADEGDAMLLRSSACGNLETVLRSEKDSRLLASRVDGFVRGEPESFSEAVNALQMVAHGAADFARVERLGSGGYDVRAPLLYRFLYDPMLAVLVAILGALTIFSELLGGIRELGDRDTPSRRTRATAALRQRIKRSNRHRDNN